MNVYVATKAENFLRAREIQQALIDAGHTITHDWTAIYERNLTETSMDLQARARQNALEDLHGVLAADVVVLIGHDKLTGALIEFGAALGAGKPVFLMGQLPRYTIFQELYLVKHFTDDDEGLGKVIYNLLDELEDDETPS